MQDRPTGFQCKTTKSPLIRFQIPFVLTLRNNHFGIEYPELSENTTKLFLPFPTIHVRLPCLCTSTTQHSTTDRMQKQL